VTAGLHAKLIQHPNDAAAFEEFRGHSALPKVMLFTDKAKSTVRTCLLLHCLVKRGTSLAASCHILNSSLNRMLLRNLSSINRITGTTKSTVTGMKVACCARCSHCSNHCRCASGTAWRLRRCGM
jgi:hypothetical protein